MTKQRDFSIGRLALFAVAAGVGVMVVGVPIVMLIAKWSPIVALILCFVLLVGAIAAMGLVASRIVNKEVDRRTAQGQVHDEKGNTEL